MKKYGLLFISILFTQLIVAQINFGQITYKVRPAKTNPLHTDSLHAEKPKLSGFVLKIRRETNKAAPFLTYILKFNSTESIFHKTNTMKNDNGLDLKNASMAIGIQGTYYNNRNGVALHQFNFLGNLWLVKTKDEKINWRIGNKTKEIMGYTCRIATATIDLNYKVKGEITAWFAPNIPFHYGPAGFSGLPGLILNLNLRGYVIYATQITLEEESKSINKPHKGLLVSKKEYQKEIRKRNPFR